MNSSERTPQDAGVWLEQGDLRAPDCPFLGVVGPVEQMPRDTSDSADFLIGEWWHPTQSRPLHATRCVSIARSTGKRCRRWSTYGQARCPVHSGYGLLRNSVEYRERVLQRASEDLWSAAPYTVENLMDLVTRVDVAPAVRLRACLTVLDRVGVTGTAEVGVNAPPEGERAAADIIRARLEGLAGAPTRGQGDQPFGPTRIEPF